MLQKLSFVDPAAHRAELARAIVRLVGAYRVGLWPAVALSFARQSVELYEELAGLRAGGSTDPVDTTIWVLSPPMSFGMTPTPADCPRRSTFWRWCSKTPTTRPPALR